MDKDSVATDMDTDQMDTDTDRKTDIDTDKDTDMDKDMDIVGMYMDTTSEVNTDIYGYNLAQLAVRSDFLQELGHVPGIYICYGSIDDVNDHGDEGTWTVTRTGAWTDTWTETVTCTWTRTWPGAGTWTRTSTQTRTLTRARTHPVIRTRTSTNTR
jgi:hypothetical protein